MFYFYEAKIRFFYILLYFFFTWFCSYFFCNQILYILTLPLKNVCPASALTARPGAFFHLIFTEITEIFFTQTKLATYLTFIFLLPILCYQFWLFIKPGLYQFEKYRFLFFIFLSGFLAIFSVLFTYFILLPTACKFFLGSGAIKGFHIYLEAKTDKYISFILNIFLSCYLIFQVPIIFFVFFIIGLLNEKILIKRRRIFYLVFFFFIFFLMPPNIDFFNSFFILSVFLPLLPFFFFYELALLSFLFRKRLGVTKEGPQFSVLN